MAQDPESKLDRDQQILNRLARIEYKVDSLEQTTAFALRADADRHFASAKEIFGKSKRRAQVYLAVDGSRGVLEIAGHLKMKQPNVSSDLKVLSDEGLLEITGLRAGKTIWVKKPVDRTLRISKFLRDEFGLSSDGLPSTKPTSKNLKARRPKSQ